MRRIGIFSGAFDPVHIGHIAAARACARALGLEKILLAPYGKPHGREPEASSRHRLRMAQAAVRDEPLLEVTTLDANAAPRFAVDTVRAAQALYPQARLAYLVGADKLSDVPSWREAGALFELCEFAVFPRAGYDAREMTDYIRSRGATAHLVPWEPVHVSSGLVRAQLRLLQDAPRFLHPGVAEYIAMHGLYQADYAGMVRKAMSDSRFRHTLGVRATAVRLARAHGVPMQKAGVAAVLHDCAKCMELPRLQAIARAARLTDDPAVLRSNALLHGLVAAHLAKVRYNVGDEDVLNAIRFHTTGRAGMSMLELALFVADKAEPTRDYPGVGQLRKAAAEDLRQAALASLVSSREALLKKGGTPSPLSDEAIRDLRSRVAEGPG